MILREIKQHHIPAVLSIGMLFIVDTFASFTNPMSKKVVLKIEKILN